MLEEHRTKLNRMWDLHAEREKRTDQLQPVRLELEDMRRQLLLADSMEEAVYIRNQRTKLKNAYIEAHKPLVGIDKELSKLSRSIPGNYIMYARSGRFQRVPEALRNFKGWARKLSVDLFKKQKGNQHA